MYLFFLDSIQLPITPSKITTTIGNNNKTFELANSGEVNLIKFPKLTTYKFEFELVHQIGQIGYRANDTSPKTVLDFLEDCKKNKKVITFSIVRKNGSYTYFPSEQKVTVESYDVIEDADNNSDMTVSIELKQFRAYRTKHLAKKEQEKRPVKKDDKGKKAQTSKKSTACLKRLKLQTDMNIRSGAGTHNRKVAIMKKDTEPVAYAEYTYEGTTWYKIKHSKGDGGYAWISGNPKYMKVIRG